MSALVLGSQFATAFAASIHGCAHARTTLLHMSADAEPVAAEPMPVATETAPKPLRKAEWNPQGLDVSMLPDLLKSQFVGDYLKTSPTYLDGSLPGDIGFDPWGLVALAYPTKDTDMFARTAKARDAKMLEMSLAEQQQSVAWMRESELKHGRLAMLAAAGWPMAEIYSNDFLHGSGGTQGRAPSLFNGHLLDYLPFLLIVFGPIAYLDLQSKGFDLQSPPKGFDDLQKAMNGFDLQRKGELNGGDYEFDPMGLAGPQKPAGAVPFDALMTSKPVGFIGNTKDIETMKLAEIKNGRVAMMAITGMAVQECLYGAPVIEQTPFFFGR